MKFQIVLASFALIFAPNVVNGFLSQETDKKEKAAAFALEDVKYFHRFTKADQHEYTPDGQEDLKSWTDMVTIH